MNRVKRTVFAIGVVGLLTSAGAVTWAQTSKPEATVNRLVTDWLEVCSSHAKDYQIHPSDKPDNVFKLLPNPIFRHSQPVRGDDIGAVWLWVDDNGRPGVVGTVFAYTGGAGSDGYRHVTHEFHSLSDEPIVATWRNKRQWSPVKPGLEWNPIPVAPTPADSPAQRMRQMGELARQFHGHEVDSTGGRWELRLVPKPVYHYALKETAVVQDGALFVFCQGTDPEIFVSIEARRTQSGYQWNYACAAFSDYELHMRHQETEVWAAPRETYAIATAAHWWNGQIEPAPLREDTTKPPAENRR
ncbi:MAG: hypothetical protein ACYC4U_08655 [Pirellulaceae bacterium]